MATSEAFGVRKGSNWIAACVPGTATGTTEAP
jgi:hypothetical protein